jgi:hypothetical protein
LANFYPDTARYPKVVKAVLESFVTQTARLVYPEVYKVEPIKALQRFIPSEIDGSNFNLREATRTFEEINFKFPFTIYNFDLPEVRPGINQVLARGEIYSDILKRKIATYPSTITIKMLSFFSSPDDYFRAYTYMNKYLISLHRYYAGLKFVDYVNNQSKIVGIPYDIKVEFEKGMYVNRFQEYLKINRIYDIVFSAKLNYWDFFGSDVLENLEVKDIILNINEWSNTDPNDNTSSPKGNFRITSSFDIPMVTTNIDDIDLVDYKIKEIEFKFDKEMDELHIEDSFILQPTVNYILEWSNSSDELTVRFMEPLDKNTDYVISFKTRYYNSPKSFDYSLSFKTEE